MSDAFRLAIDLCISILSRRQVRMYPRAAVQAFNRIRVHTAFGVDSGSKASQQPLDTPWLEAWPLNFAGDRRILSERPGAQMRLVS